MARFDRRSAEVWPQYLGAVAGLIALTVVAGWIVDLPLLRSFRPGRIETKIITALALLLASASVILLCNHFRRIARVLAAAVLLLAVPSLFEYLFNVDIFGRSLLVFDIPNAPETIRMGRMAPNTALAFVAAAMSLLLLRSRVRHRTRIIAVLNAVPVALSAIVLFGVVFGGPSFRGLPDHTPMALPTATGIFFLSLALIVFNSSKGSLVAILSSDGLAARMARRLIPAAILVPLLAGWLRLLGQRRGLYGLEFGTALFALIVISGFFLLIWITARQIDEEDRKRQLAEARLRSVLEIQQEIGRAELEPEALMNLLVARAKDATNADAAALLLATPDDLVVRAATSTLQPMIGTRFGYETSATGRAVTSRQTMKIDDVLNDPHVDRDGAIRSGVRAGIVVPLLDDQKPVAALWVVCAQPSAFSDDDVRVLQLIAGFAGTTLGHAEAYTARSRLVTEQSAELSTLQQQFTAFMTNTPTATFIKDSKGFFLYANPSIEQYVGASPDEILGTTDFDWISSESAHDTREAEELVLQSGETIESIDVITVGGQHRAWLTFRFPIGRDGGSQFIGGVASDVTERREAEDQLRASREEIQALNEELERRVIERTSQLEAANRELEAFSYSVSHDLRSPLRAVGGYARMLEEDYADKLDANGKRFIHTIREEAARMGVLIDDLLAFSRIGRQPISASEVSMRALFTEAYNEVRASNGERPIDFRLGELLPAVGDRNLLRQVTVNLVSNAVKFTGNNSDAVIEVGSEQRGDENLYWVRDNGAGFDMRYVDKLFGVFQRLHRQEEFEGTGVGLAIVQRVVNRHGGRVWAESKLGEGACFYFTLPNRPRAEDTRKVS